MPHSHYSDECASSLHAVVVPLDYGTQAHQTSRDSHILLPSLQIWVYYYLQNPVSYFLSNLELKKEGVLKSKVMLDFISRSAPP